MAVTFPLGITARGNGSVFWLPTVAGLAGGTVAEYTAGLNISCAISGFGPTADQSTVTKTRYCSRNTFEVPGTVTTSIPAIEFVYDPQEPDSDGYAWFNTISNGLSGWLANRLGVPYETNVAVGQFVNLYRVTAGPQLPVPIDPTSEGDELRYSQRFFVVGDVRYNVAVAAA